MAKKFNARVYHDIMKYSDKKEYKGKGKVYDYDITIDIDWHKLAKGVSKAQWALDDAIMTSMVNYMPMNSGTFIQVTLGMSDALAGTGIIVAAAPPMGRYLYYGKTMVDEKTGNPWARKGAKKVLVSQYAGKTLAKENLEFGKTSHHKAQPRWFDVAKAHHYNDWEEIVAKTVTGELDG